MKASKENFVNNIALCKLFWGQKYAMEQKHLNRPLRLKKKKSSLLFYWLLVGGGKGSWENKF